MCHYACVIKCAVSDTQFHCHTVCYLCTQSGARFSCMTIQMTKLLYSRRAHLDPVNLCAKKGGQGVNSAKSVAITLWLGLLVFLLSTGHKSKAIVSTPEKIALCIRRNAFPSKYISVLCLYTGKKIHLYFPISLGVEGNQHICVGTKAAYP